MEKKMQKRSIAIVLLSVLFLIITCIAVLFAVPSAWKKTHAEGENEYVEPIPVATYHLGQQKLPGTDENGNPVIYFPEVQVVAGWAAAVKAAIEAKTKDPEAYVKVVLDMNWTAAGINKDDGNSDGFGSTPADFPQCYSAGRLYVPGTANIILDLNGHTLDRNLAETDGIANGQVFIVQGTLTVKDSSIAQTGTVTGGYTNSGTAVAYGGGVYVYGGTVNWVSGLLQNNQVATTGNIYGIGVSVANGGTFNMYGGTISGHENLGGKFVVGGGVGIFSKDSYTCTFNMYGGVIENNTAAFGGGAGAYCTVATATASINIEGGIIRNNRALKSAGITNTIYGGGAIGVYYHANISISGGEICNNFSGSYGGGVYAVAAAGMKTSLTMSSGEVHHNTVASVTNIAYGGGVAVHRASTTAGTDVVTMISGGSIRDNLCVANVEDKELRNSLWVPAGGGISITNATVTMTNGAINNNSTLSWQNDEDTQENWTALMNGTYNLEDLRDGYYATGGGVDIYKSSNASYDTGSFTMSGGVISGNRSGNGGGLNVDGIFTLTGGRVTNNKALGSGAMYLTGRARVSLSGRPIIEGNTIIDHADPDVNGTTSNLYVNNGGDCLPKVVGAFEDGAVIHMFVNEKYITGGTAVSQQYGMYNSKTISIEGKSGTEKTVYANPYRFFVTDDVYLSGKLTTQHLMVLADGELGVSYNSITFRVVYEEDGEGNATNYKDYTFGEKYVSMPEWNYIDCSYTDSVRPIKLIALVNGEEVSSLEIGDEADIYTLSALPSADSKTKAEFSVIVQSKPLSNADTENENAKLEIKLDFGNGLEESNYHYTGSGHTPTIKSIMYNGVELYEGEDKDFVIAGYENNVNAGQNTAAVVIKFVNNYSGEVRVYFSIGASLAGEIYTKVTWEYKNGETWDDPIPLEDATFIYNGEDQGANIRARLTADGDPDLKQAVYAKGILLSEEEDDKKSPQNTSMFLTFDRGSGSEAFLKAGTYTVIINGESNYQIEANKDRTSVSMGTKTLGISADEFVAAISKTFGPADKVRPWTLVIDTGSGTTKTNLIDEADCIDPNADENEYGLRINHLVRNDAIARYRGTPLSLEFNREFVLKEELTIGKILDEATNVTFRYSSGGQGGTTGIKDRINTITTTVTITFNESYEVSQIQISKTWYIVTMANDLRDADSKVSVTSGTLKGWTFGVEEELHSYIFRPEHGNTVIYSYYNEETNELAGRYALIYSNDTYYAVRQYYNVNEVDGKLVVDTSHPIDDLFYQLTFHFNLKAGTYRMEVTVPENKPVDGTHRHWYEGDKEAEDNGVLYYAFTLSFHFTVKPYVLAEKLEEEENLTILFPEYNFVEYTGESNNYVHPKLTLFGKKVLVEGEDYILLSTSINAGSATLTIQGLNSIEGIYVIENAYTIIQASNNWVDVPTISHWTYHDFYREVNLITATPKFGSESLWFAISRDAEGEDIVEGLEHITIDAFNSVDPVVEEVLNNLAAGYYYLCGYVTATDNYAGLTPRPVEFRIFAATNSWEVSPSVKAWTVGEYTKDGEFILVQPRFGDAHIVIKNEKGKTFYDSEEGIDILSSAKPGRYYLVASVEGTSDYSLLDEYTFIFEVFKKPGLPWWATLLITVGALGAAALILFILWKEGVFRVVTDKILIAIRTRVSVEATIASVRAAKRMEEGRKSVAEAKRRERLEQLRKKQQELREMSPEERAAVIEEKAKADAERAEKLRARSESAMAKAAKMRGDEAPADEKPETETSETAQTPDEPTEE